jgi:integrase/recombinase XerD
MKEFKSNLSKSMNDFLSLKEALGFSRKSYEPKLHTFDDFILEKFPDKIALDEEMVQQWALVRNGESQNGRRARLNVIRGFGKYLKYTGQDAFVLDSEQIPRPTQYIPYIFTENELRILFGYMDTLDWHKDIRDKIVPVLFRMMYCCALRPSEPLALKREDVDLVQGTISIIDSKKHSNRILQMSEELWQYCKQFDRIAGERQWFFSIQNEERFINTWSRYQFIVCWKKSGLGTFDNAPRPYDFRHTAATRIIMNWQDEGKSFESMVLAFQTFMGHKNIKDSLYYLKLIPERLLASPGIDWSRFDNLYQGGVR